LSAALFAVRAVSGQTAVLPIRLMNSRRLMGFTPVAENHLRESLIRSSNESYAAHRSKTGRPMSALGQKQTSRAEISMSALPPKADIAERDRHVCFVPKADKVRRSKELCLFDHFVGGGEQRLNAMTKQQRFR
jgi:hypothetical protein